MPTIYPMEFYRQGDALVPVKPRTFAGQYDEGEVHTLAPWEPRSQANHNHYFAAIAEAWRNLPDDLMDEYPTPEILRKKALIRCGYADERSIVCASVLEARKVAAFLRPIDEYAIVEVRGNVVRHYTAQSQSMRAMQKGTFQESKDAVLGFVAGLIKVTPDELQQNAGRAA